MCACSICGTELKKFWCDQECTYCPKCDIDGPDAHARKELNKMKYSVSAFIIARNEEKYIGETIDSLKRQTKAVYPIIVVDDGSTDATSKISTLKGCYLVQLPYHKENYVGRPELATVCNAGLKAIKDHEVPDFVIHMGADHVLSDNYVESVVSKMGDKVKVASGGTQLGGLNVDTPWGSGRIIDAKIWDKINGMQYPVKWGYESWIVYKVQKLGYEVKRYDDVKSVTRPLRMYPEKAFNWGRCSYALGGALPFALLKAGGMGLNGLSFMKGYFSRKGVDKNDDISEYVKYQQYKRARAILISDTE